MRAQIARICCTGLLSFLATAVTPAFAAETMPAPGQANCLEMADRNGCRIAWDLSAASADYYVVERFDAGAVEWQRVGRKYKDSVGATKKFINRGGLYRVAACSKTKSKPRSYSRAPDSCAYSTVTWIPYYIEAEELPEQMTIKFRDSEEELLVDVSVNEPELIGMQQFNVYTAINTAYALGLDLPEMSEPVHPTEGNTGTIEHGIRDGVWKNWKDTREMYLKALLAGKLSEE